ncbi:MAG: hypothetical protein AB4042_14270 [Leptolyngbyaceae cyanobacterium]
MGIFTGRYSFWSGVAPSRYWAYGVLMLLGLGGVSIAGAGTLRASTPAEFIRPAITCPSDINGLLPMLLRDLPSYANRISSRSQVRTRSFNPRGLVITAAQPDVANLEPDAYGMYPTDEAIAQNGLTPLFFTTLERHYQNDTIVRIQHYHWAFLARTQNHETQVEEWGLAMMFSRIGDYPAGQPVSPPRESRQGTIGQGLQLWLRDCNVGSIEAL